MKTKMCKECGKELPISEFYPNRTTGGYFAICKKCGMKITTEKNRAKYELSESRKVFIPKRLEPLVIKCCETFKITRKNLFSKCRYRHFVFARKYLCQLFYENGLSSMDMERMIGLNHTTVLYNLEPSNVERTMKYIENNSNFIEIKEPVKRFDYRTNKIIYEIEN